MRSQEASSSTVETRAKGLGQVRRDSRPLEGLSVLIVEDDDDTRELTALALKRSGAQPIVAADVESASDLLGRVSPQVILSDIRFGRGKDGFAFVRALRESRHAQIPVIALSGDEGVNGRALEAGFDVFLLKPVTIASLVGAIADAHFKRDP